ncbi:MAG: glycosyltransferase family 4 protein [Planctomycetaceae bacterium]|nr:glycosyltransferase family 4 protein [Planctomycetaceae bacterium]
MSVPAKCLHLINGEHYSGAERVQDLLAISLPKFGYEVEFASLKLGKFSANRRSSVPLHEFPMRGRVDFSTVSKIATTVRDRGYHLLHAHTPRSLMVAAQVAQKTRVPLVYHVHSPVGRDSTRWFQNQLNLWIEKLALRRVAKMIAVSDNIAQYMAGLGYGEDRVTVVPNGVPVISDESNLALAASEVFRSPWQWTLGTVALFRPRKGTEVLLEALARLKSEGLDVGVLAVGGFETAEYEQSLRAKVEQLKINDRVHWTGFTQQVNAYFPKMDLFVLPSLFGEGLPMVILEAMALGKPVIASRVEGISQALRDGVDGKIVQPGCSRELAIGLQEMLQSQSSLKAMGQAAQQRQRAHFSDLSMCQGTAKVYDQILGRIAFHSPVPAIPEATAAPWPALQTPAGSADFPQTV